MARHHMRRIVALAAAAFLVSTSAGAMASEETPAGSATATASSADSTAAGSSSSSKSESSTSDSTSKSETSSKSESSKPDSSSEAESSASSSKSEAAEASAATEATGADPSVGTEATDDATVTTSAVSGDAVASVPVTLPPGLNDGRIFPDVSNTPDGVGVLVGGGSTVNDGNVADTWIFKDGTWLPVCGTTVPGANTPCALPARSGGALATAPGGVVMFGGHSGGLFQPSAPSTSDTWKFDGSTWTQVCPDGACGPEARSYAAAAGNAAMTLMFGGLTDGLTNALEDTWAFDGTSWTQLCGISMGVPCGPSARFWSSMSWDGTHFVLFGGMEGDFNVGASPMGDTWIWTGTSWQLVCATGACGPAPRARAAFPTLNSPDPALAGSFLAGGFNLTFGRGGVSTAYRDLWFWSAQDLAWRQLTSPWGPDVSWTGDGPPPVDGIPLAFGGAATNDCQVVFYGTVIGPDGNGASNTSNVVGWDNGEGRPATCAEQALVVHGGENGELAEFEFVGGLPFTGGSPLSSVALGSILALVGFCLVLAGRRRALRVTGV